MPHLPFYKIVKDGNLSQGDILPECEILIPTLRPPDRESLAESEVHKPPAVSYSLDVVVMSQSCDLRQDKTTLVVLCPVLTLQDLFDTLWAKADQPSKKKSPKLSEIRNQTKNKTMNIANGKELGKYMLEPCTFKNWQRGLHIVDFAQTFSAELSNLTDLVGTRKEWLTINPPYREHLSQAFGLFFMRIALKSKIPESTIIIETNKLTLLNPANAT